MRWRQQHFLLLALLHGCASQPPARTQPEPTPEEAPRPAPAPPRIPPPAPPSGPLVEFGEGLELEVTATVDLPAAVPADAVALALLEPGDGFVLLADGSDRVHILELASGTRRWRSRPLGGATRAVAACGERFAAFSDGGGVALFEWVPERGGRVIARGRLMLSAEGLRGFFAECSRLALDGPGGTIVVLDALLGRVERTLRRAGSRSLVSRPSLHSWLLLARGQALELRNLKTDRASILSAVPLEGEQGSLLQAHVIGERIVAEHCDAQARCALGLREFGGASIASHAVDGSRSGWGAGVPSRVQISAGASYATWQRAGLPVQLIELSSGRRAMLGEPGAVAFSRHDERVLVRLEGARLTRLRIGR